MKEKRKAMRLNSPRKTKAGERKKQNANTFREFEPYIAERPVTNSDTSLLSPPPPRHTGTLSTGMSTPYEAATVASSSSQQPANTSQQQQQQPQPAQYAYPLIAGQQPQAATQSQPQASTSDSKQPQTRLAAEAARKDRKLAEFLLMLDDYEPLVSVVYSADAQATRIGMFLNTTPGTQIAIDVPYFRSPTK
jgi:hypothetical protein